MSTISAKFYDGNSPIPHQGWIVADSSRVFFTSDERQLEFSYKDISGITVVNGDVRLVLKDDANKGRRYLLSFCDDNLESTVRKNLQRHRNFFKEYFSAFYRISFAGQLAILLLAISAAVVFILWGTQNLYLVVPSSLDRQLGKMLSENVEKNIAILDNRENTKRLNRILAGLVPGDTEYNYQVSVIKDEQLNAFALPGGHVYLYDGILKKFPADEVIAGVLAHEIAHVEKRHGVQQLIRTLGIAYIMKIFVGTGFEELESIETLTELSGILMVFRYSRHFEREADLYSVDILHKACISVEGLIHFLQEFPEKTQPEKYLAWINTHPSTEERIEYLKAELEGERVKKDCLPMNFPGK